MAIQQRKEKKANLSVDQFSENATNIPFVANGKTVCAATTEGQSPVHVSLVAKEFESGSVGYGFNGNITLEVSPGVFGEFYMACSIILKGSKPSKKE